MTHPSPDPVVRAHVIETRILRVSPDQAAEWLTRNPRNRAINQASVVQFAADMATGRWHFNGQPIIFDTRGNLSDGQHRLTAQVRVGATIDWLVVGGVDEHAPDFMDIGRPRTVANQLQIAGRPDGHAVAAVARLVLMHRGDSTPSKPQIRTFADEHYDRLAVAGTVGRTTAQLIRGSMAGYGVAHFHIAAVAPGMVGDFFEGLQRGAGLEDGSPILVARNQIMRAGNARNLNEGDRVRFVDYLHKTWNLWITRKRVKSFAAPTGRVEPNYPTLKAIGGAA